MTIATKQANFLLPEDVIKELRASVHPRQQSKVVAELHAGMREQEREMTTELLDSLTIESVTREISEKAGTYKRTAGARRQSRCRNRVREACRARDGEREAVSDNGYQEGYRSIVNGGNK